MRSIKRGRGPSFMGGVAAIAVGLFGVFWTMAAAGMGAPLPFVGFGVVFIGIAVADAIYNFRNATGKTRYSEYDIVDAHEEPDPLNERFGQYDSRQSASQPEEMNAQSSREAFAFCPYCGAKLDQGDVYCGKCGKRIA